MMIINDIMNKAKEDVKKLIEKVQASYGAPFGFGRASSPLLVGPALRGLPKSYGPLACAVGMRRPTCRLCRCFALLCCTGGEHKAQQATAPFRWQVTSEPCMPHHKLCSCAPALSRVRAAPHPVAVWRPGAAARADDHGVV
jgi:hypothetical protein